MTHLAAWLAHAWAQLAAAAAPYALLAGLICWLIAWRVTQEASPKAYAVERRLNALVPTILPAAIQPGSSPPVAETWHDLPAGINSWGRGTGGWAKYRLLAEGSVELSISLRLIGTKGDGTGVFSAGALPTGYQPSTGRFLPVSLNVAGATFWTGNHTPFLLIGADGGISCYGVNATGLTQLDCHGPLPLV